MARQGLAALVKGPSRQWARTCAAERGTLLPCLYMPSRSFSSKLFVGGLSYHTTEEMVRTSFAQHGDVVDVRIITDRETGQSRGFGFVTFASESEAEGARSKMNNHLLDGRYIRVDLASSRPPQSPGSPRPSGNPPSSSSSGFTFSNPGARPPSVEDWSPLPFRAPQATQTSGGGTSERPGSSSDQGSSDTGSIGTSEPSSGSSSQQAEPSFSSNVLSRSSTSEAPMNSFDTAASSSSTPVANANTAAFSDGSRQASYFQSNSSTQGIASNVGPASNVSSANDGHSSAGREAGTSPTQTARIKLDSNFTSGSRSRSGGAGRPPSVINLGSATYDFSKFPEFDASVFKNSKVLGGSLEPKKPAPNERSKLAPMKAETWEKKLTVEAIPPAEGPLFEFNLSGVPAVPSPSDAGYSPHGAFSVNVNLNELPEAEPVRLPYSIFTARTLPPLDLPWLTPEADNWSPIGKPPRRIEDSPYSPFSPDLKDDPEFWWDPYDFDPEAKVLKDAFAEEPKAEDKVTEDLGIDAKKPNESETVKEAELEAKVSKDCEVEDVTATNVATS